MSAQKTCVESNDANCGNSVKILKKPLKMAAYKYIAVLHPLKVILLITPTTGVMDYKYAAVFDGSS